MVKKVLFISQNENKKNEMERIFEALNMDIQIQQYGDIKKVVEIQTMDLEELVKDKIIRVYEQVKRPVIIEHTVLKIHALNGYPGTTTQLFWDTLKEEGVLKLMKFKRNRKVDAQTMMAYCDGKHIVVARGITKGVIAKKAKGNSKFQWDTIFIPQEVKNGKMNVKTFAELEAEEKKDEYSMRKKAAKNLVVKIQQLYEKEESIEELYDIGISPVAVAELAQKMEDGKLVLFVGAGVSRGVGLPSWQNLIEKLGNKLQYNNKVFERLGDYLDLAEYYDCKTGQGLELVKDYFEQAVNLEVETKVGSSNTYEQIAKLPVKRVYTTNYEHLLEMAYDIYTPEKKVHTVYDLATLNLACKDKVQIIKLHGDIEKNSDMVLTQTTYFKRYDFENSLDILLRGDLLNTSVLFIGYSFNDPNVKYMLYKLNELWSKEDIKVRPKSYIFLMENNPIQRKLMKENYNIESIVTDQLDKSEALNEFLKAIHKQLEK